MAVAGARALGLAAPQTATNTHTRPAQTQPDNMSPFTNRNRAGDRCRCGVLPGAVAPGDRVAIVGAGPVGLAALQTAALASPAAVFVLDISDARLQVRARVYPTLAPASLCLLPQHTGGPHLNLRG